jgi:hypothetical protein
MRHNSQQKGAGTETLERGLQVTTGWILLKILLHP